MYWNNKLRHAWLASQQQAVLIRGVQKLRWMSEMIWLCCELFIDSTADVSPQLLIHVLTIDHLKTNSQQLSETCEATDKSDYSFSELSYTYHFVYACLTILGTALDNAGTYIPGKL